MELPSSGQNEPLEKNKKVECEVLSRVFHRRMYEQVLEDPQVQTFLNQIDEAQRQGKTELVFSDLKLNENIHKMKMEPLSSSWSSLMQNEEALVIEFSATSLMAKYADALSYACLESELHFKPSNESISRAKTQKSWVESLFGISWFGQSYNHVLICEKTETFDLIVKIPQKTIFRAMQFNPNSIYLTRKYVMPLCTFSSTEDNTGGYNSKQCIIV